MATALAQWDRHLAALEARATLERDEASRDRRYQLRVELAIAYRARGLQAAALRELDAAVALRPAASDLQLLRALTLEDAGRVEEADQAFVAAWNRDARSPAKAYYVSQRAGTAVAWDRDRARSVLARAYKRLPLAQAPPTAPFPMLTAIVDGMSRTPVVADASTAAGFALLVAGNYSAAVDALTRTDVARKDAAPPGESEDDPSTRFTRGQQAEAENRVVDARREYEAALEGTLLGRSLLLVGIARLAQVDGDLEGAVDAFGRAVRAHPNDPNIRKEFASAYVALGRLDDAFCELMAALVIDPRDGQAHAAIGQVYLDTGRHAEAAGAFTTALELVPNRYEARYGLATALVRLGRTQEAARQLDLFERSGREATERRRQGIAIDTSQQESVLKGLGQQGGGR
jgi:tetratricopeptide (TPR) repeat protein